MPGPVVRIHLPPAVSHVRTRNTTFQMAEVAVPRQMFQEILMLIAQLRAPEVATRRSEFAAILKAQGIDGLIAALNRKADILTGTTARSF